jgi:hypothetical protein
MPRHSGHLFTCPKKRCPPEAGATDGPGNTAGPGSSSGYAHGNNAGARARLPLRADFAAIDSLSPVKGDLAVAAGAFDEPCVWSSAFQAIPGHRHSSSWMRALRHWLQLSVQARKSRASASLAPSLHPRIARPCLCRCCVLPLRGGCFTRCRPAS